MSSADRCVIIAVHNHKEKYNPHPAASVDRHCAFLIKVSRFVDSPQHAGPFYRVQAGWGACGQKPPCPWCQTWWVERTWRRGWRKSWTSSQSWLCQRSRRRTGTRTGGWRKPEDIITGWILNWKKGLSKSTIYYTLLLLWNSHHSTCNRG